MVQTGPGWSGGRRFMLTVAGALVGVFAFGFLLEMGQGRGEEPSAAGQPSPPREPLVTRPARLASFSTASALDWDLLGLLAGPVEKAFPRSTLKPSSLFDRYLIVSYYGHPGSPDMGVLGEHGAEAVVRMVAEHSTRYDRQNGIRGVLPALHLIYAVAQGEPGEGGRYLARTAASEVRRYIDLTSRYDMLLFLDIQVGRSSVRDEVARVLPFLRYPNVHLALDPEFAVTGGEVPGRDLGSLSAAEINEAQAELARLVRRSGLPPKILVVHQFTDGMLTGGEAITAHNGVDLVVDVDGFGPAETKRAIYERFAARAYARRPAIKLFFQQDPDLMTEEQVLSLVPAPDLVIYQ